MELEAFGQISTFSIKFG